MTPVLSNILSAYQKVRQRNEREPKPLEMCKKKAKRRSPTSGRQYFLAMGTAPENSIG
jgi:hypothetical protein